MYLFFIQKNRNRLHCLFDYASRRDKSYYALGVIAHLPPTSRINDYYDRLDFRRHIHRDIIVRDKIPGLGCRRHVAF